MITFSNIRSQMLDQWKPFVAGAAAVFVVGIALRAFAISNKQKKALGALLKLPGIRLIAQVELQKQIKKLKIDIFSHRLPAFPLPEEGMHHSLIIDRYTQMAVHALKDVEITKLSGTKYHCDKELNALVMALWKHSIGSNPNHSDVYRHINAMEADILAWTSEIFNGGYGTITSGGSESNFLAVRTYLKCSTSKKPNMVLPSSAHVSLWKAADDLGVELRIVPVTADFTADIQKMSDRIDENTIMLVGSFPSYPSGVSDDIEGLAQLALERKLPLHVDACLGGFVAAFAPHINFSGFHKHEGITSISADYHKYGLTTPKGASVILFRTKELREKHYYLYPNWEGGFMFSRRFAGSYPSEPIVATWATMQYFGRKGYTENASKILYLADMIREAVRIHFPDLKIMGNSRLMVVGFQSKNEASVPIMAVCSEMAKLKWNLNTLPNGFHLCITMVHAVTENFDQLFLNDLRKCVSIVKQNPRIKLTGTAAAYCLGADFPDYLIDDLCKEYLNVLASTDDR